MENQATFKAVLRLKAPTDKQGIICIRKTQERKSTYVSLGIKLPVRHWNDKAGTVRQNKELDFEHLNNLIKEKITELELLSAENLRLSNKESYIDYIDSFQYRYERIGTKRQYSGLLVTLRKFLKENGKKDLMFKDINVNLIYQIRNFLLKRCSNNTTNDKLKLIRHCLDSAIKENVYNYVRHPFLTINFKYDKIYSEALDKEEVAKIIDTDVPEKKWVILSTKHSFLCQIFLQGCRASDLLLLRYSNIKGDFIEYEMMKTRKRMRVYINRIVWSSFIYQFNQFIKKENLYYPELKKIKQELESTDDKTEGEERLFELYKELIREMSVSDLYKNRFIFDYLRKVDFSHINERNDFSKISEKEYESIRFRVVLYNQRLKKLQKYLGINKNIHTHIARHTFASLLLDKDVNLYTISQTLGHSSLKITERYLSVFKKDAPASVNNELAESFL